LNSFSAVIPDRLRGRSLTRPPGRA